MKTYMRDFKEIKKHISTIKEIDDNKCWLLIDNEEQEKYCFLKENNNFVMKRNIKDNEEFNDDIIKYLNLNNKIFTNENEKIIITNSSFKSHNWIETISYNISSFESNNFRKNSYFQLVIDTDKKYFRLDFIFSNLINISTGTTIRSKNGITFEIDNIVFNLYFINDYFIIENLNELEFNTFDTNSRAILMCFGILSGYVPRKEGHYFSYKNNNFDSFMDFAYASNFIDTYNVPYKPIDSGLHYSFTPRNLSDIKRKEFKQESLENLFLISNNTFSKLCNLCTKNKKIARTVELIMEANQVSLEAQGIVYSVILEILTGYVAVKNEDRLIAIPKSEAKQLRKECHNIAKKYLIPYKNSILEKNINKLNSPTNMDKLLKPFEFLKIPLTDMDKKIINYRNEFLHGNDFIKGDELLEFSNEHLYINFKLNFLVYALLLKIIGHNGKIVNMVKLFLSNDKRTEDENFYRDIGISIVEI